MNSESTQLRCPACGWFYLVLPTDSFEVLNEKWLAAGNEGPPVIEDEHGNNAEYVREPESITALTCHRCEEAPTLTLISVPEGSE